MESHEKESETLRLEIEQLRKENKAQEKQIQAIEDSCKLRVNEAIKESRETYLNLFQNAQVGLFRTRITDGKILEANHQIAKMFGYDSRDSFIWEYKTEGNYVDKGTREKMIDEISKYGSIQNFRARFYKKDKTIFWAAYSAKVYPDKGWIEGIVEDITQQVTIQQELIQWKNLMQYIIQHDPNAISVLDKNLNYIFVSERYLQDYGIKEADIIGKNHYEVIPEIPQKWREIHQRVLQGEILKNEDDFFIRQNGKTEYTRWECRPYRNTNHEIDGIILYTEVITKRKTAEQALIESEAKYRILIENQTDLIVKVDTKNRFLFVSPSYCNLFGKNEAELLGKTYMPLVHPDDLAHTEELLKTLQQPPHTTYIEQRAMTKNGWQWLAWMDTAILDEKGKMKEIIGVGRNITQRKAAEEEILTLKEKLEIEVKEKTKELQNRILELERFHQATIDREFRIKELLNRIEEMEVQKKT